MAWPSNKMDKAINKSNFLLFIPKLDILWDRDDQDRVYLIKERSRNRLINKLIDILGGERKLKIHLDDLGSSAWLAVDGEKNILEISSNLRGKFGERIEPAEERVAHFFAQMVRNGFISFREPGQEGSGKLD